MPQSSRASGYHSRGASSEIQYAHSKKLSIPRERSSSRSWARFCNDALTLLVSNYSVAIALGEDVDASVSSATDLASNLFTPNERDVFTAWRKGKAPPKVDWRRLQESCSGLTPAQKAKWAELTRALRVLYGSESLSRENCKAWVEKYPDMMPLLNACRKVETVRMDSKAAKVTSKARKDVHEIVICRKIMAEIGKERVRANTDLKDMHKESTKRELDLIKRLARVNRDEPKDRDAVTASFAAREQYHDKLVKVRTERIAIAADVARLNSEINSAELALKERIAVLEERFKRLKS